MELLNVGFMASNRGSIALMIKESPGECFFIKRGNDTLASFREKEHAELFVYIFSNMNEVNCPECDGVMKPLVLVHLNCKNCKETYTR